MSSYGWIITKDYDAEGPEGTYLNAVGVIGPSTVPDELKIRLENNEGARFRT